MTANAAIKHQARLETSQSMAGVHTIEDILKLIPNKGDSIKLTNGMTVTNNGTYTGFSHPKL